VRNTFGRWLVFALVYGLARLLACRVLGLYDDAFITYRYAANLASGVGFVYNPGDPVLGTTTPLFAAILGLLDVVGLSPVFAGRLLGLLAEATLFGLVMRRASTEGYALAGVAALALALIDPYISRIVAGGMESPLFVLASFGALFLMRDGRAGPAAIVAVASAWLRPEGALTIAIVGMSMVRAKRFPSWPYMLAALLALGVPALLLHRTFGSVIPQSLQAKADLAGLPFRSVAAVLFGPARDPLQTLLTVTTLVSLPWVWRHSALCRDLGIWSALYAGAYLIAQPQMWSWYALPVYTYKCIASGIGFAHVAQKVRWREALVPILLAGPVALWVALLLVRGEAAATKHIYRPLEAFIGREMSPADSVYAHDIGVVGYHSQAFILDHFGLVWKGAERYRTWRDLLTELQPKWAILVTPLQYREYLRDPTVSSAYRARLRLTETGETSTAPDTTSLGREWTWDYLVLERVDRAPLERAAAMRQAMR